MKVFAHSTSVFNLIPRLLRNFSKRRKWQFFLLLCLMVISAFAEVVSLGAVLPFLAMLTAPEKVFLHPAFSNIAKVLEVTSANQLMVPLTILFIIAALIAGGIRILLLWSSSRLTSSSGSELSIEVYRRILYQPYYMHVTINSSDVISNITNKVNGVVFGAILPLLTLVNSILLLVAIILALIVINPLVALIAMLVFGISYVITAWFARRRLQNNSQCIVQQQSKTIKVLQESLGGIRDVILDSTQILYSDIFRDADIPLRRATGDNNFIGQFPRYAMETIGIIMIAVLAYFLSRQPGGIDTALPILGAMGIGSQRLLPALQQIYSSWVSIVGNHTQLVDIIEILEQPLPKELSQPVPLNFYKNIQISKLYFRYSNDSPWILDGIDLNINKGARVGFIGSTGTGKSTLLDVIMGLLLPTKGEILVDNQKLVGDKLQSWQRNIAHVPQNIYLADTTLSENIAFGVPSEHIDMNRVRYAAKLAQIDEYIESNAEGYNTFVGERGIQISGGQRQRIGIARALYKQAEVLIFDEATSALDSNTEQDVMKAIDGLNRNLTILIIAHRLTSLKDCDIIIELKHGKILRQGSYKSLIESNLILQE
jgi:ABC-type multidrug transport system fused ATPase/permease subunit